MHCVFKRRITKTERYDLKDRIAIFSLILIITAQCILLFFYAENKNGFHVDEMWSYGLSNSYDAPFFYPKGYMDDINDQQFNNWMSGQQFLEYITVQPNEQFAYNRVYYNQTQDVHPPFYYFILHTICSLFPDTFSKWFGIGVNIALFAICQFFLYFVSMRFFCGNNICALMVNSLWGFSMGAVNTVIFIRMYMLMTLLALISVHLHGLIMEKRQTTSVSLHIAIGITSYLGFMTQYYFLFISMFLAIFTCLFFVTKKQYKKLMFYCLTMCLSLILLFTTFPYIFDHLFNTIRGTEFANNLSTIRAQYETTTLLITAILQELLGLPSFIVSGISIVLYGIASITVKFIYGISIFLIIFCLRILFMVRKNDTTTAIKTLGNKFLTLLELLNMNVNTMVSLSNQQMYRITVVGFTVCYTFTMFILAPNMDDMTDRYLFCIYPLVSILFTYVTLKCIRIIKQRQLQMLLGVLTIVMCCIFSHINSHKNYLFTNTNGRRLFLDQLSDSNIIYINHPSDYLLHVMPYAFMNSSSIYPTRFSDINKIPEAILNIPETEKKIIIFPNTINPSTVKHILESTTNFSLRPILFFNNDKEPEISKRRDADKYPLFYNPYDDRQPSLYRYENFVFYIFELI